MEKNEQEEEAWFHTRCTWPSHSEELLLGCSGSESHFTVSLWWLGWEAARASLIWGTREVADGTSTLTRSSWVGLTGSLSCVLLNSQSSCSPSAVHCWKGFSNICSELSWEPNSGSDEVTDGTRLMFWGFMSWNQAMMLPRRLALSAESTCPGGSGKEPSVGSWLGLSTMLKRCGTFCPLMLPSFFRLSPSSRSSELLRAARGTSVPWSNGSSLEGREVPMAPRDASWASSSWVSTAPPSPMAIPDSCRESWMASRMLGSSSSKELWGWSTEERGATYIAIFNFYCKKLQSYYILIQ